MFGFSIFDQDSFEEITRGMEWSTEATHMDEIYAKFHAEIGLGKKDIIEKSFAIYNDSAELLTNGVNIQIDDIEKCNNQAYLLLGFTFKLLSTTRHLFHRKALVKSTFINTHNIEIDEFIKKCDNQIQQCMKSTLKLLGPLLKTTQSFDSDLNFENCKIFINHVFDNLDSLLYEKNISLLYRTGSLFKKCFNSKIKFYEITDYTRNDKNKVNLADLKESRSNNEYELSNIFNNLTMNVYVKYWPFFHLCGLYYYIFMMLSGRIEDCAKQAIYKQPNDDRINFENIILYEFPAECLTSLIFMLHYIANQCFQREVCFGILLTLKECITINKQHHYENTDSTFFIEEFYQGMMLENLSDKDINSHIAFDFFKILEKDGVPIHSKHEFAVKRLFNEGQGLFVV